MEIKKFNRLPKQTSLKLQWNMSIVDYNNNRISEEELKLKFNELKGRKLEVIYYNYSYLSEYKEGIPITKII